LKAGGGAYQTGVEGDINAASGAIVQINIGASVHPQPPEASQVIATLKRQHDIRIGTSAISQGLAYHVPLAATPTPGDQQEEKQRSDLHSIVEQFMAGNQPLLLLQGDSGSGKTTYMNWLAEQLWEHYDKHYPDDLSSCVPVLIELKSLPALDDSQQQVKQGNFLRRTLQSDPYNLSDEDWEALRRQHRLVFLFDGYDEMSGQDESIYQANQLDTWDAKVIITCRSQYLASKRNYKQDFFYGCQEWFLAPFSPTQIDQYIECYAQQQPAEEKSADNAQAALSLGQSYQAKLQQLPAVYQLIASPLLLHMVVQVLPELAQQANPRQPTTRADIYAAFIKKWVEREFLRVQVREEALQSDRTTFDSFVSSFDDFVGLLAFRMLLEGTQGKALTEVPYRPLAKRAMKKATGAMAQLRAKRAKESNHNDEIWHKFFGTEDDKVVQHRAACPLRCVNHTYSFYHRSFLEYFIADYLYERSVCIEEDGEEPFGLEDYHEFVTGAADNNELWCSQKLLVKEPSVLEFLADKVNYRPDMQQRLLAMVYASRASAALATAAANAITVLNIARFPFSGLDFSSIRIGGILPAGEALLPEDEKHIPDATHETPYQGANLDYAILDSTNLKNADLRGVSLHQAFLRNTQLQGAHMAGVRLGQRPYLQHEDFVNCILLLPKPDGTTLASGGGSSLGSKDNTVRLWDTTTGTLLHTLAGHTDKVTCLAVLPDGTLASGSSDNTVRLWDTTTGTALHTLAGHTYGVTCLAVLPDGTTLASGSYDSIVRLWDTTTGTLLHTLTGHTSRVTCLALLRDGTTLASGGWLSRQHRSSLGHDQGHRAAHPRRPHFGCHLPSPFTRWHHPGFGELG